MGAWIPELSSKAGPVPSTFSKRPVKLPSGDSLCPSAAEARFLGGKPFDTSGPGVGSRECLALLAGPDTISLGTQFNPGS